MPFDIGDEIELIFEQQRENLTLTVTNGVNQLVENYTYPITPKYLPNMGNFAFWGYARKYEVSQFKIETNEILNADIAIVGDSKAQGFFADSHATTFAAQLRAQHGSVINLSGGSERTNHMLDRVNEVIFLNPAYVFFNGGSNDNRDNRPIAEWALDYDSFVNAVEAAGIQVIHVLIFPETVEDVTAYNNRTLATYPIDKILDCGSPELHSDGAHLTQLGHDQVAFKMIEKITELLTP